MSRLIDSYGDTQTEINGRWYIAKCIVWSTVSSRLKDAIKVFLGKARAIHFKEDEKESKNDENK